MEDTCTKIVGIESEPCPFPETINYDNFFRFDKAIVKGKIWAALPKASKSIFPVIAVHADKKGISFPSQERIGHLSGCSPKTVRKGIKGLEDILPGFNKTSAVNTRGQRRYIYNIPFPPIEKGRSFFFYRSFIDGGNWRLLSPVSKAVYIAIRSFSYFEPGAYCAICDEIEDHEHADFESNTFMTEGYFKERSFDLSELDDDVIVEYSGISSKSLPKAFSELEETGFIEWAHPYWKAFRLPPHRYKRDYLMSLINKTSF